MTTIDRKLLDEIATDYHTGASQLAKRCLDGISRCGQVMPAQSAEELLQRITQLIDELENCRPSMLVIANQMRHLNTRIVALPQQALSDVRTSVQTICQNLIDEHALTIKKTMFNMLDLIVEGETLLVHSDSSLIRQILSAAAGKNVRVVVTESRPGGEAQSLARLLYDKQIPVSMVCDSQCMLAMEYADRVMVGADSVAADGSIINKVGTHPLALAAAASNRPLYVVADMLKYSDLAPSAIPLEQIVSHSEPDKLDGMGQENRWFEITPARLVTAWVNECGVQHEWQG